MANGAKDSRKVYIALIESQKVIDKRYTNVKAIDENGGDGNFSLVFTANDTSSKKNREVVLKFLHPEFSHNSYRFNCFNREVAILQQFKGQRNILPIVQGRSALKLSFKEAISGLTLPVSFDYYVSQKADFSINKYIYTGTNYLKNIRFFREMCKSIQRLHSHKHCHRDLKPSNFLVYGNQYVCLSDFGTAREYAKDSVPLIDHYTGPVGDLRYAAPELLCGLHFSEYHNYCADIYSLGTILFELFSKAVLGTEIEGIGHKLDLIANFNHVPERERQNLFDKFIVGLSASKKLPTVQMYDDKISKQLAFHIDRLYHGMAHLDYRKRMGCYAEGTDFHEIFLKINICEKIIRYHMVLDQRKKRKSRP